MLPFLYTRMAVFLSSHFLAAWARMRAEGRWDMGERVITKLFVKLDQPNV